MRGTARDHLARAEELDGNAFRIAPYALQMRPGEKLNALVAKRLLHDFRRGHRMIAQNIDAALDERNLSSDTIQELRELACDDSAAENDHALWNEIEIEHIVAGPEWRVREPRHRWHTRLRAGGDEEVFSAKRSPVRQLD